MKKPKHKFGLPIKAIDAIKNVFSQHRLIDRVWIYGSRAMGNYKTGSDIDLCIESQRMQTTELLRIENELDDLLLPWKIDLSLKHQIDNSALIEHINALDVRFYERNN